MKSDDEVLDTLIKRVEVVDTLREDVSDKAKATFEKTFDVKRVDDPRYVIEWVKRVVSPQIASAAREAFGVGKRL